MSKKKDAIDTTDGNEASDQINEEPNYVAAEMAEENEDEGVIVSREFLLGDLIKAVTRRFKTLTIPFGALHEREQQVLLSNVADDTRRAVKEALRIICSDNRTHFMAEVEQVVFKEGVKAVLKMMNTPESHELADKAGGIVMVVIADSDAYMELGDACNGDADQRPLFDASTDPEFKEAA